MSLTVVPPYEQAGALGNADPELLQDPLQTGEVLLFKPLLSGATKAAGAIVRYTVDEPETITDPVPVVIMGGLGGSEAVYADLRENIAEERRAVTILYPRTIGDQHPVRMQSKAAWAVAKKVGKESGAEDGRVDLVVHSRSAPIGAEIAVHKPYAIRNLVILGGAGLTGHTMLSLAPGAARLAKNLVTKDIPILLSRNFTKEKATESLRHIAINPLRTLGEVITAANCDMRLIVPHKDDTKVTVVQFEEDELFRTQDVVQTAKNLRFELVVIPGMRHAAPITHPQEVASVVNDILRA